MREKMQEAAKRASDLSVERDDFGCRITLRPYGFLVDATKEEADETLLRKSKMVMWEHMDANPNALVIAVDGLLVELCGSMALQIRG